MFRAIQKPGWQAIISSLILWLGYCASVQALSVDEIRALSIGENETRIHALNEIVIRADEQALPLLQGLLDDAIKIKGDQIYLVRENQTLNLISGQPEALPSEAEDVVNNNRMRRELENAMSAMKLFATDNNVRLQAARALQEEEPDATRRPLLEKALQKETSPAIKNILGYALAGIDLTQGDAAAKIRAAEMLAEKAEPATRTLLLSRLKKEGDQFVEPDAQVRAAVERAVKKVQATLSWGERFGALFTGISLGSVLLLAALGLAITYGLMGVINMAHGELIMIGAYTTYVVQNLFRQYLPAAFDWYLLAALPLAFLMATCVGMLLERLVIRHLYGRPLETLLATWGISLILIQLIRTLFGAQNVQVENPTWMSGGIAVMSNLILPYNRIVIIGFAIVVLLAVAITFARTRLGLFVRSVTQNRAMASCMGVPTARIDTLAFGLGSGIAGLAGAALTQIGNVGPDLGQAYIVDSFMVVVLGGVGQLAGTIYAALGLGIINKLLEGMAGAVLAKIAVLVFIILFIQKRPQGLFALKGRAVE